MLDSINRAESAGITFPFAEGVSNESLFEMLYRKSSRRDEWYALPDFAAMDEKLKKPTITLMLLWNRYIVACKLYLYDPITDERIKTSLFVATFSFSDYFYSEAFTDQKVRSWILANEHALQFFGGVPLSPLPPLAFQYYERKMATVAPDFHIEFDKRWYSVSWNYVRRKVLVKATASIVLVFDEQGIKIARHKRSLYHGQKSTNPDHLPANIREVSKGC